MNGVFTIVHLTLLEARRRRILLAGIVCALAFIVLFGVGLFVVARGIPSYGIGRRFPLLGLTLACLYVASVLTMIAAALLVFLDNSFRQALTLHRRNFRAVFPRPAMV